MSHRFVPRSSVVFTPAPLAQAMVAAAGDHDGCRWLDPCVGDGAFVAAIAHLGVAKERILAVDIAPRAGAHDSLALVERGTDFIDWATRRVGAVDRVVMNPPYVALSRLRGRILKNALEARLTSGKSLPFKANYWCAFVLRAVECLRTDGVLVAVLPAAWDFARYARLVRESIFSSFRDVTVIRSTAPLFPTVQDGSVVLVARGRGHSPAVVRRIEVSDHEGATHALRSLADGKVPSGAVLLRGLPATRTATTRLDDLIDIRIGAVTGDANYFLLTDTEREALNLPRSAVKPVLSRSRHLTTAVVSRKAWDALRQDGARVWLFRPVGSALRHRAVKKYLTQGKKGGACNTSGFKIRSREPWHRTPLPGRVDAFLSGMSKRLPFLVLREMPGLSATNTLYVVSFRNAAGNSERATLGILLLSSAVRRELARHARVYADGLLKFEPSELGGIQVPVVQPRRDAMSVFRRATALLLAGKEREAEALADAWIAGSASATPAASHGFVRPMTGECGATGRTAVVASARRALG